MDCSLVNGVFALVGTAVGAILTVIGQLITNVINSKKEIKRIAIESKIKTYANAIRYAKLMAQLKGETGSVLDDATRKDLIQKEGLLHDSFYPDFSVIAPIKVQDEYYNLLVRIEKDKLSISAAYQEAVTILNWNISNL